MATRSRSLTTVLFVALSMVFLVQLRSSSSASQAPRIQRLISSSDGLLGLSYDTASAALWAYSDGRWDLLHELPPGEWIPADDGQNLLLVSVGGEVQRLDGQTWSSSRIPLADGIWIQSVIELDNGYRAYAIAHSDDDRVFRSSDGLEWHPTSAPPVRYLEAVPLGGNASAVYMEDKDQTAVAFHSDTSWTLHSFTPEAPSRVFTMAATEDELLVVGQDSEGPAAWLGPPLSPLVRVGVPVERAVAAIAYKDDEWLIVGGRSEHASSWSINSQGEWREIHIEFATRFIDVVLQDEQAVALVESGDQNFVICLGETWERC